MGRTPGSMRTFVMSLSKKSKRTRKNDRRCKPRRRKFQEERREQQVALLRKPSPVTAPLIQYVDEEGVPSARQPTFEIAEIETIPARRSS